MYFRVMDRDMDQEPFRNYFQTISALIKDRSPVKYKKYFSSNTSNTITKFFELGFTLQ